MATLNQLEEAVSIAAYIAKFGAPLTVPPNYAGDASASTELIPIWLKNAFKRDSFPGHVTIEAEMHTMKKAGDALEKDIGEAIAWIQAKEKQIVKDITDYIHDQLVAMTAGGTQPSRAAQACAEVILFVKQVIQLVKDLQEIITGLMDMIRYLISVIQRLQAFLQHILNAIATLINQICNFHLPALPSIPNLFGGLHFDGFKFTKGMFNFQLSFNTAFAFGNCQIRNLGLNPFTAILQNFSNAAPLTVNPSGYIGAAMTDSYHAYFVPPLSGLVLPVLDPLGLAPSFTPSFNPLTDFTGALPVPSTVVSAYSLPVTLLKPQVLSLVGGPTLDLNPAGVTSSSSSIYPGPVPYSAYLAPVRAFCQAQVTLDQLQLLTGWDPSKLNPGGDQPSPAWALAWAWLTCMNQCRGIIADPSDVAATPAVVNGCTSRATVSGRGGAPWIPAFQAVYAQFVDASSTGPCFADINAAIPWNAGPAALAEAARYASDYAAWVAAGKAGSAPDLASYQVTPQAGAQHSGPAGLAFFSALAALDPATRGQVLWMLSYLEASLLGYPRSRTWDGFAPGGSSAPAVTHPLAQGFASGPTGTDLDYLQLATPASEASSPILLDSGGLANYPSTIEVPHHLIEVVTTVVGTAGASILNDPDYSSTNQRNMSVFTAQATAIRINSYSQFWRDFAANWVALLGQPGVLPAMACNYPAILGSALNPRSGCARTNQGQGVPVNPQDPYTLLCQDFQGRTGQSAVAGFLYHYTDPNQAATSTQWAPGWPWLDPGVIPEVLIPATGETVPQGGVFGAPVFVPGTPTGWPEIVLPDGSKTLGPFDPAAFYQRPDIMALPYTEQLALCQLNQAFDDVLDTGAQLLLDNQNSINACYASLADAQSQTAGVQAMALGPMRDALGNPYYMDANSTPLLTASGTAAGPDPSFDDFYPMTPGYVPQPPFSVIPVLTPPASPGLPTQNPPGVLSFTDATAPVPSMYVDPIALPGPADLPTPQSPGNWGAPPVPVVAVPSLQAYRQQLLTSVPAPITVTVAASNPLVQAGTELVLRVTASQDAPTCPLSYQWQLQQSVAGVTSFADLPGQTGSSLDLGAVTLAMNQQVYQCVVRGTFGAPTSSALITVSVVA